MKLETKSGMYSGTKSGEVSWAQVRNVGFTLSAIETFEDVKQTREGAYFHWGKHLLGNWVDSRLYRGQGR